MRTVAMNIHGYSMQKVNKKAGKYFQKKKKENTSVKVIVLVLSYFLKKDHGKKDCSMPDILLYILFLS